MPPIVTAIIYGKDRQPDKTYTPESLRAEGLHNVAAEMEKDGIIATYAYLVGKHAYQKDLFEVGAVSFTRRIW